jgi:hypothetical protein
MEPFEGFQGTQKIAFGFGEGNVLQEILFYFQHRYSTK